MRDLSLLTSKPMLFVCNVGERDAAAGNAHLARELRAPYDYSFVG